MAKRNSGNFVFRQVEEAEDNKSKKERKADQRRSKFTNGAAGTGKPPKTIKSMKQRPVRQRHRNTTTVGMHVK